MIALTLEEKVELIRRADYLVMANGVDSTDPNYGVVCRTCEVDGFRIMKRYHESGPMIGVGLLGVGKILDCELPPSLKEMVRNTFDYPVDDRMVHVPKALDVLRKSTVLDDLANL